MHFHVPRSFETAEPTLTIRLQLNPDFDREFPCSKSLILMNMHMDTRKSLIEIGLSCSLIVTWRGVDTLVVFRCRWLYEPRASEFNIFSVVSGYNGTLWEMRHHTVMIRIIYTRVHLTHRYSLIHFIPIPALCMLLSCAGWASPALACYSHNHTIRVLRFAYNKGPK